jgi:CheY-like chemotaxis protein
MKEKLVQSPVMVAEDSPDEALLLDLVFEAAGVQRPIVFVWDGQQAIDHLSAVPEKHPRPCLLLLDLNMPRRSGFDVLEWLQSQPRFRDLPAIVLTASDQDSDRDRALKLGARQFLTKPLKFQDSVELVRSLHAAWVRPPCPATTQWPPAHP